ncbi:MAG: 4-phosphoerythronate dehydrogenase [Muribaculaceae bacterium]|nr:4-phosphoerythronate dehydrogenase [Muribaculaceae bacterium]
MAPNVIVERNVPYMRGVLEQAGASVRYLAAEEITPAAMADADALITRTRTRCDASLLEGSRCKIIASATIGLDHIDVAWCEAHGITVHNAPGCNAPAVAQYVMASILQIYGTDLSEMTLGVVGVGHVGSIVERWARSLGMRVLLCDPPRAEAEGASGFCTMEQVAQEADIVTFHTPLTKAGPYATWHLCDEAWLNSVKRHPLIINAARGAVVDTDALVRALDKGTVRGAVIDCWEGEPDIDRRLLARAAVATPHIAGYSAQGKARASYMAVKYVTGYFGLPMCTLSVEMPAPVPDAVTPQDIMLTYSPEADTTALREAPEDFELLRNGYNLRQEPV